MNTKYKPGDIVLNNWTLVRLIGEGNYGSVFEAERKDFGNIYKSAIKIITIPQNQSEIRSVRAQGMDDEGLTEYFNGFVEDIVRESALMSRLKGTPNVVSYEDHSVVKHEDEIGWDIIIRMELLTPLFDYSKSQSFTRQTIIKLGMDICSALEICQKHNIVHRDIKPENIFVSDLGDFKLGDFGIARTVEKTSGGLSKKGTYTYMAPEVYRGEEYGPSVDIYSLGLVLYRMLNDNRTPFLPEYPAKIKYSDQEAAKAKRFGGTPIPAPKNADGRLAEIVLKACAFDPKLRHSSPMQLRQELEAIAYTSEEAPIIYPKGDATPVKSLEYVDTDAPEGSVTTSLFMGFHSQDETNSNNQEGEKITSTESHSAEGTVSLFGDATTEVRNIPHKQLHEPVNMLPSHENTNVQTHEPTEINAPQKELWQQVLLTSVACLLVFAGIIFVVYIGFGGRGFVNEPDLSNVFYEPALESPTPELPTPELSTSESSTPEESTPTPSAPTITHVGEIIQFGGRDWRVLEVQSDRALILHETVIVNQSYHHIFEDVTWETSSSRAWLNGEFLDDFSAADRARIQETYVVNSDNPQYGTSGGYNTMDKIFLLSIDEVRMYFEDRYDRTALNGTSAVSWWLRSPGHLSNHAARVGNAGHLTDHGNNVDTLFGVRPALWLCLESASSLPSTPEATPEPTLEPTPEPAPESTSDSTANLWERTQLPTPAISINNAGVVSIEFPRFIHTRVGVFDVDRWEWGYLGYRNIDVPASVSFRRIVNGRDAGLSENRHNVLGDIEFQPGGTYQIQIGLVHVADGTFWLDSDLSNTVTYTAPAPELTFDSAYAPTQGGPRTYTVTFDRTPETPARIAIAPIEGDPYYQIIRDADGNIIPGRYNPATGMLEARITESGMFQVVENRVYFDDIQNLSEEMQRAIRTLATQGIISGVGNDHFAPDDTITRAQFAQLITRMLGLYDPNANGGFEDVQHTDWFFGAVGSATRHALMEGTSETTFSPNQVLTREESVSAIARVLRNESEYLNLTNPRSFLQGQFTDYNELADWSIDDIALAARHDLIPRRTDGRFAPHDQMTRGDVAVILHRLYERLLF